MAAKAKKPAKKGGKKAAAPTKEETTEQVMSLLMGDNMPPTKDINYHYDTILGLMDKASLAQSKVSDAKKKAKDAGVDVQALMNVKKALKADPLDLAHRLRQEAMLLREKGSPIQMQLYEPKFGTVEDQAKSEGWNDGINARNMNISRWPEGSPGYVEYTRSWNDAQAENASKITKAAE